jgi:RNA polymerase sigma-70 factor, ECF subfamily
LTRPVVAETIVAVDEPRHPARQGCELGTLGDLLYADKGKATPAERDWVALVRSIAAGDQLALQALYVQTHRIVFTLIWRIVRDRETAEELTLDVFHAVWRRAAAYDAGGGSVLGWMLNQARSRAIDRVRFEQRKKRLAPHPDRPSTVERPGTPHELLEVEERGRLLRDALRVLRTEEREAIETAFFSELTYGDAAVKLNQPVGTLKTRIRSGLSKLRQALGQESRTS